jgi:hypothetical protein
MTTHEMLHDEGGSSAYLRRFRWGLGVFIAIAVFFLWEDHRAHLLGVLAWLLLLACPVMHLMHRRHGGHESRTTAVAANANQKQEHGGHGCC